jgi:hypothetical protein
MSSDILSFSSSEDSTEESDLESLATSQIVRPKQMKRNHTAIAKLSAFTGKEKWIAIASRL